MRVKLFSHLKAKIAPNANSILVSLLSVFSLKIKKGGDPTCNQYYCLSRPKCVLAELLAIRVSHQRKVSSIHHHFISRLKLSLEAAGLLQK
jgi:hypothetical protein